MHKVQDGEGVTTGQHGVGKQPTRPGWLGVGRMGSVAVHAGERV